MTILDWSIRMNNKMKKILLLAIFLVFLPKEDYDKIDIKVGKSLSAGESLKVKSKSNLKVVTSDEQVINNTNNKEINIKFDGKNINLNGKNFNLNNFPQNGAFLISSDSPIYVDKIKRNYGGE